MRGCVELGQDSDTADQSIIDYLPDHLRRVDLSWRVAAVLNELGPRSADVGKAVRVGDVPVEGIQLRHGHAVDRPQDPLFVDIIPARVEQNSAIRIFRGVHDVHLICYLNLIAQVVEDDELTESLQSVSSPEICIRRDIDFYL